MTVYILWHVRETDGCEDDSKLIGVYSSQRAAGVARDRSAVLPGFRELPDAFIIDSYEIDKDHWTEGYISWDEALKPQRARRRIDEADGGKRCD